MKKSFLFLFASLIYFLTFAQVPGYVPQNGLVAWWSFDGNANDQTGNGHHGIINGATLTTDRYGNPNSAYSFNGTNNWITIPNHAVFNPSPEFTVSFWVKSTANHTNAGVIGKYNNFNGSTGSGQEQYALMVNGNGMNFTLKATNLNIITEPTPTYNDGNWHLYVGIYSGNTKSLWRDGVIVKFTTQSGPIASYNQDLEIGRYMGGQGAGKYFNGQIDDIGFWNRSISQQEVEDLYMAATGINNVENKRSLSIYPNPSNGSFTIDFNKYSTYRGSQLKITNLLGLQVYTSPLNGKDIYLNHSSLPGSGVYFIHIIDEQGSTIASNKLVLQ